MKSNISNKCTTYWPCIFLPNSTYPCQNGNVWCTGGKDLEVLFLIVWHKGLVSITCSLSIFLSYNHLSIPTWNFPVVSQGFSYLSDVTQYSSPSFLYSGIGLKDYHCTFFIRFTNINLILLRKVRRVMVIHWDWLVSCPRLTNITSIAKFKWRLNVIKGLPDIRNKP